jgi:hypothetical protein
VASVSAPRWHTQERWPPGVIGWTVLEWEIVYFKRPPLPARIVEDTPKAAIWTTNFRADGRGVVPPLNAGATAGIGSDGMHH